MKARVAWGIAILSAVAVAIACAEWIRQNPRPSYYDEALYQIYAWIDVWATRTYGLVGGWFAMLSVDPYAPPGMRMLALPFTLLLSPSLTLLRALSLAGFFAAAAIIALAVRRVSDDLAGATTFAFIVALPILVLSTRMFGTEYPLLLAVALALLAFTTRRTTLLIALSVAIGLLAKTSYAVIALPMFIAAAIVLKERRRAIALGSIIGFIVALSWWSNDPMRAIRFGVQSGNFIRHSFGHNYLRYTWELLRCDFGFLLFAAVVMIAVIAVRRRTLPRFATICLAGALPLLLMHAASVNHNPRLVAIPVLLITVAAATMTPLLTPRQQTVAFTLAILQIAIMVVPMPRREDGSYIWRGVTEVMAPIEQWNWQPLHQFASARGWSRPRIVTLGEGYQFNAPQIRCAWPELRGNVPVGSLYEWSKGQPFDLRAAVEGAASAQIVVTAIGYRGEATDGQVPNNRYNALFAEALARDGRFDGPYVLDVGTRHPVRVQVFARRGA